MEEKRKIYALYTCDVWKGRGSMSPACFSTSEDRIIEAAMQVIAGGGAEFGNKGLNEEEQAKLFAEKAWRVGAIRAVELADYLYLEVAEDGEMLA